MSTTTNFGITLIEVGQREKEAAINTAFSTLDSKIVRYLGELAADPTSTAVAGCTYFNTATSRLRVKKTDGTWVNAA